MAARAPVSQDLKGIAPLKLPDVPAADVAAEVTDPADELEPVTLEEVAVALTPLEEEPVRLNVVLKEAEATVLGV